MPLTGKLRHINVCSALKRQVRDKKLRPEIQVSAVPWVQSLLPEAMKQRRSADGILQAA